jgi:hypothetical protein
VVDGLPRIEMSGHNYLPVLEQLDGDTVIVEWDLAVSREDTARFTAACQASPGRVRVAPYKLYPISTNLQAPVWAHRRVGRNPPWITPADQECDLFGFGLAYLPHMIVKEYLETGPEVSSDALFSQWHHTVKLGPVPVCWDVQPVHLHH